MERRKGKEKKNDERKESKDKINRSIVDGFGRLRVKDREKKEKKKEKKEKKKKGNRNNKKESIKIKKMNMIGNKSWRVMKYKIKW